ncbi:MAG: hypothetical protein M3Q44_07135 [bacterium]|nr:hypothetical protein [bacterium]
MNKRILSFLVAAVCLVVIYSLINTQVSAQSTACSQSVLNVIGARSFSGPSYTTQVACLLEGSSMYLDDLRFQFFKVGSVFQGKSIAFIKTNNLGIKDSTTLSWNANITQSASVYVLYRKIEGQVRPSWLSSYTKLSANSFADLSTFLLRKNEQGLLGVYDVYQYNGATPGTVTFGPASSSIQSAFSMYLVAVVPKSANQTASPAVTSTPAGTPTVTPGPGGTVVDAQTGQAISSRFGIYPNCVAPATPIESHSWWTEDAGIQSAVSSGDHNRVEEEQLKRSRHIHYGICAPNTRDTTGQAVSVSGSLDLVARVVTFNHPGRLTYVQGALCGIGAGSGCPGEVTRPFSPAKVCQSAINVDKECIYYMKFTIDTTKAPHNGIVELRMRANSEHPDLANGRHFTTMNAEIYVKNANISKSGNYRDGNPIARGWYTGMDYAIGSWKNFINLFGPDPSRSVPLLRGVASIKTEHSSASGLVYYRLVIDPDYHHRKPGTIIYADTNATHTTSLDTTKLSNGRHLMFVETTETNSKGAHKGQLRLDFDVQN